MARISRVKKLSAFTKPYPDFPLFPSNNGQWRKDIWDPASQRAIPYCFGPCVSDPKGDRALLAYLNAKEAIANGTYHAKIEVQQGEYTVVETAKDYLTARYEDMVAGKLTGSAYQTLQSEIKQFGGWAAKNIGVDATVNAMKVEFFTAYVKHLITVRELGPHAEKRVKSLVKTMFKWAADNGRSTMPSFGTAWKAPNTSKAAMKKYRLRKGVKDTSEAIWTGQQIDQVIKLAPKSIKAMILLSINCGVGPADLGRLHWRHVNMETGELNMPRGKTGQERHGYVWKRTRKLMLQTRQLKHNRLAYEREGEDALIFVTRKGLPFFREEEKKVQGKTVGVRTQQSFGGTFRRVCKQAKIKGLKLYQIRHTFATVARFVGQSEVVNYMMGHTADMVKDTYDHTGVNFADWKFEKVKRVSVRIKRQLWPRSVKGPSQSAKSVPDVSGAEKLVLTKPHEA